MRCLESLAFVCVYCFLVCCSSFFFLKTFTPLYSGVKETLENNQHACIKRVVWSLLITNDLLPDMDIVLWRINFKSIPYMREHFYRQSCYPCLVAKHDQSSGEGGCTVRTFVPFQRSWRSKHPKLSIFILRPLLHSFTSLATLRQD